MQPALDGAGAALEHGGDLLDRQLVPVVQLEGDLLASESTRFSGAQYPVNFYSFFGALRGCYNLELSARFGWVGCAGAQVGVLGSRESGGDEHRAQGLWLAAEAATAGAAITTAAVVTTTTVAAIAAPPGAGVTAATTVAATTAPPAC